MLSITVLQNQFLVTWPIFADFELSMIKLIKLAHQENMAS